MCSVNGCLALWILTIVGLGVGDVDGKAERLGEGRGGVVLFVDDDSDFFFFNTMVGSVGENTFFFASLRSGSLGGGERN